MQKKIILIGGGGHCKSCIDVIESTGLYSIESILDSADKIGHEIFHYRITGSDSDIPALARDSGNHFLITLGQIKSAGRRMELYSYLKELSAKVETVVSPFAHVSAHSRIGEGTIIMHMAVTNAGSTIGRNCIINTGAIVEHDSQIGDHVHVSTRAVVNGGCVIGEGTFIGSGAVINNDIKIGTGVIIGSGTVVNKNITESGTYAGNPVRKIS